jgi:two-component system, chemotaxis family, CheB/CheR fusion protein
MFWADGNDNRRRDVALGRGFCRRGNHMSSAEPFEAGTQQSAYNSLLDLDQAAWNSFPFGLALFGADGRAARLNGRAEFLWRRNNEPVWHERAQRTSASETAAAIEQALRFGTSIRDKLETIIRGDGAQTEISSDVAVLRDAAGGIQGALHCFREIHPALSAREREHLASIVDCSDDAIISKDLNGVILSWNKGAEQLFGYTSEEAVGKSIIMLIPEHRTNEEPEILRRIRSGERIDHYETVRRRKDGTLVDISLTVSPMRDGRGEIFAASKIARNISEHKRAEAQRNLLVAELNHRVKNTLATVVSIARQSFAGANAEEARTAFDARIRGLAQTHGRLADTNWESVSLETLFADEFAPYRQQGSRNINFGGAQIDLSPRCALTLGLAVHELVTNAAKYGALSTDTGTVDVCWSLDMPSRTLDIRWVEEGGPAVSPPRRSGFGRLLLERALVSDLNSEVRVDFDPRGLRCRIRIPAPQYSVRT